MQPSTSINFNINLIKFPQFPVNSNPKHTTAQNKVPTNQSKNQSNSLTLKTHTQHNQFYYQNMQDSPLSSSFQEFHPTMSTQSLCKAKKIYQKTIKSKTYSNHSMDQFYDVKIDPNSYSNNLLNGLKNSTNNFSSQKSQQQQQSKRQQKSLASQSQQHKNDKISDINSKSKKPSSNHSSSSSTSSYHHHHNNPLPSKQPLLRIDCQDTFQQHQSNNDFVEYGLFSQHFKKGTLQADRFKKKKSTKNNYFNQQQIISKFKATQQQENIKSKANQMKSNKDINHTLTKQLFKYQQQSHSKSKSKSKSKQKNNKKQSTQQLRQLNFLHQTQSSTKYKNKKNPIKQRQNKRSKSKSPYKNTYDIDSQNKIQQHVESKKDKVNIKRDRIKSRSQSKNHKHFIRSKDQFTINHNLSPSPSTRGKQNKSRPSLSKSKSKSKSRSRSNSQIKTYSNSKSKKSNQKSIKRNKLSQQKSLSPSFIRKNKFPVKEFNERSTYEVYEQNIKASNSKEKKKSLSKQKAKKSNQQIKSKKSINQKQSVTGSKEVTNQTQRNTESNKFSKNKSKKIAYAKTDVKQQPEHSKSTNFYLPQRKQRNENTKKQSSVNNKSSQQKQAKRQSQRVTVYNNSQKQKSQHELGNKPKGSSEMSVIKKAQRILNAVMLIQRVYRGYRVRRQLNEDLMVICSKVSAVREKISDKKSKYWMGTSGKKEKHEISEQQQNMVSNWKYSGSKSKSKLSSMEIDHNRNNPLNTMFKQSNNKSKLLKGFESMLSSSNSIQSINYNNSQSSIQSAHHSSGNININNDNDNQKQHLQQQHVDQSQQKSIHSSNNIQQYLQQQQESFCINCPQEQSKSSLLPQDQIRYLQQLVSRDVELTRKLLKQNQQLKEHIRSISSEHLRSTDVWRDQIIRQNHLKNMKKSHYNDEHIVNGNSNENHKNDDEDHYQDKQTNIHSQGHTQVGLDNVQNKEQKTTKSKIDSMMNNLHKQQDPTNEMIINNSNPNPNSNKSNKLFEFFEPYSPKHYIISPKNNIHNILSPKHIISPKQNPSSSLSKIVSPISNASSSMFNHQIPFSLQSPQNILESQKNYNFKQSHLNLLGEQKHIIQDDRSQQDNKYNKKYFQAKNKQSNIESNYIKQKQTGQTDKQIRAQSSQRQKKIQLLNKLHYEDKLLSPKTYQMKLSKLQLTLQQLQIHKQNQQKPIKLEVQKQLSNYHQQQSPYYGLNNQQNKLQIKDLITSEQKQFQLTTALNNPISISTNAPIGKKVKLTQLTEQYGNSTSPQLQKGGKSTITKVLFKLDSNYDHQDKDQISQQQHQQQVEQQQVEVDSDSVSFRLSTNSNHNNQQHEQQQPQTYYQPQQQTKFGFPTQLLFIKNYIFEFFQYIKTHPHQEKILLNNMLITPFDNQHLLTCYRTQLQEIDPYYYNKIQGHFLSYPYWRNLIDYQPVVTTDTFQHFSHMLQTKRQSHAESQQQGWQWLGLTQEQQKRFSDKFKSQRMGLKDLQRIFLMMLMDAFNQAFQQERCSYKQVNLLKQQKGGMNNHSIIIKALNKIKQIQQLQKSTPSYYLQSSLRSQQSQLQNSANHQFFLLHQLKREKEELVDVIFCSVLKRVLQNWGRQMCGLIIEPQQQDEMQITLEQIMAKNTQRLCLALNKYVEEYEKEIVNVMREHQVCTKLILTDRMLEVLLWEVVDEIVGIQE